MRLGITEIITRNAGLCTVILTLILATAGHPADAQTFRPYGQTVSDWSFDYGNEVDVELVLAVDISQSMDADEQEVQRDGYVSALTSQEFIEAVQLGPIGKIAVVYMEWGGVGEQFVVADWSVVEDQQSAEAFASQIAEAPLRQVQRTSISAALKKSIDMVQENDYSSLRQVIDISGDGPNNQGSPVTEMRDKILASGVIINGLPLMMKSNGNTWQAMLNLDHYYEDCVIGGPGSFAIPVRSKSEFADAIRMKLIMEVAGLTFPPATVQTVSGRQPTRCGMFD